MVLGTHRNRRRQVRLTTSCLIVVTLLCNCAVEENTDEGTGRGGGKADGYGAVTCDQLNTALEQCYRDSWYCHPLLGSDDLYLAIDCCAAEPSLPMCAHLDQECTTNDDDYQEYCALHMDFECLEEAALTSIADACCARAEHPDGWSFCEVVMSEEDD